MILWLDLLLADNKTFELPVYILGNTNPSRKVYSNFLENLEGRIGLVALNPHWRGIQRRSAILSGKRGYLTDTETLILGLRDNTPGPLWVGEFIGWSKTSFTFERYKCQLCLDEHVYVNAFYFFSGKIGRTYPIRQLKDIIYQSIVIKVNPDICVSD